MILSLLYVIFRSESEPESMPRYQYDATFGKMLDLVIKFRLPAVVSKEVGSID